MQSDLDIASRSHAFEASLAALVEKPVLAGHDIQQLRQAFYQAEIGSRRLAAQIFHTNRNLATPHDDWTEFYLEALTDFFLDYHKDEAVLTSESETTFLAWLGEGVSIADIGERRLALRLLLKTSRAPERLERRVLSAILDNMVNQSDRWLGGGRRSVGVIDALDMHLILRLTGDADDHHAREISNTAVRFMLDLGQQANRFVDPEGWRRLLVEALTRCARSSALPSSHLLTDLMNLLEPDG